MPETLVVKSTFGPTTQMSSFAKWKNRFRLLYPAFNHSTAVRPPSHKFERKIPKWPLSKRPFSPLLPCGSSWRCFWNFLGLTPPLLWLSASQLRFRSALSVRVRAGVKLKHFVNPLRVEGDVHEKRRLRRGAFGPLDAHADDDFALVFLANQRAAVVFLWEERREWHLREKTPPKHQHERLQGGDPYITHAFPSLAAGTYPALPRVPFDLWAHVIVDHRHGDGVQGLLVSCIWTQRRAGRS